MFECVTILFSDVVTFTEICSRISPMEVVSMLNAMYSIFDRLTELNGVYKVSRSIDITGTTCQRLFTFCLLLLNRSRPLVMLTWP